MKRYTYYLLTFLIPLFYSCEMTEEITIDKDGSGKISYSYNMNKLFDVIPEGNNNDKEEKVIDSTFVFKELIENPKYKDSLASMTDEERKTLESLKDMTMHIKMNRKEKQMVMGFGWDFNEIGDVKDIFEKIRKAQELNKANKTGNPVEQSPLYKGLSGENQDLEYQFDGNTFSRKVTVKRELTKEELRDIDDMLNQDDEAKELFGTMKYTIKLNFYKPIKNINSEKSIFSNDRRSVRIEYDMVDFLKDPKKLDLQVELVD